MKLYDEQVKQSIEKIPLALDFKVNWPALDRLCMATVENLAQFFYKVSCFLFSEKQVVLAKGITSAQYVFSVKTKPEPFLSLTWSMDGQRAEL